MLRKYYDVKLSSGKLPWDHLLLYLWLEAVSCMYSLLFSTKVWRFGAATAQKWRKRIPSISTIMSNAPSTMVLLKLYTVQYWHVYKGLTWKPRKNLLHDWKYPSHQKEYVCLRALWNFSTDDFSVYWFFILLFPMDIKFC